MRFLPLSGLVLCLMLPGSMFATGERGIEGSTSPGGSTTPPPVSAPTEGDAAAWQIEIPRIGLSAVVVEGEDDATLDRAVGVLAGTARPGEGGNTALAAHRDTFFRPLENIEVDDRIRLVVPPHVYEYRVESLRVVEPTEVSVLDSTGVEELTLVTCYPFRYVGPAPNRFIVKATRILPPADAPAETAESVRRIDSGTAQSVAKD